MKKVQKFCAALPDMNLKAVDIPEVNPNSSMSHSKETNVRIARTKTVVKQKSIKGSVQ